MRILSISTTLVVAAGALAAIACTQDTERNAGTAKLAQTTSTNAESATSARGFVGNIDTLTTENQDFRRVVYTAKNIQLVLMALKPGEDIGAEVHDVDQFFRVEAGTGEVVINDKRTPIGPEFAIVVPAGARHNIVNTGEAPLQVYTLYAPPHHRDGVVHHTKADAERDTEHFDGRTTE